MHPYTIAAICRGLIFVVGVVLVAARSRKTGHLDWQALTVCAIGASVAVGTSIGVSRDLLASITLPYAIGVVYLADDRH